MAKKTRGQSITVLPYKSNPKSGVIVAKKTGYLNVMVNGQLFYYNVTAAYSNPYAVDFQQYDNYRAVTGRQVILVRKK